MLYILSKMIGIVEIAVAILYCPITTSFFFLFQFYIQPVFFDLKI